MHTTWANDPVNSPNHYTRSHPGMECIELTADTSFCLGNAIKYLWRYHSKGRPERRPSMTSIITNEIEERYPYPDNGERPTGITRLGQCLASRKAYRAGVCRKITDREIDMAALAVYTGTSGMGFEEVEPLWSKLNPDAKEQYRLLARLAITAARAEALK